MALTAIDKLRREHANMGRVLALIRIQLDLLARHADTDITLLGNSLFYMRKYPSAVHHPKEDAVFARLLKIGSRATSDIRRTLRQHQELYVLEDQLIDLALGSDRRALPRLLELGHQYLRTHAEHMQTEEASIFPEALRRLSMSDWKRINSRFRHIDDPMFGVRVGRRFRLLHDFLLHSATERPPSDAPPTPLAASTEAAPHRSG